MQMLQVQGQTMDLEMILDQAAKLLVTSENSNWELARFTFEYTFGLGETKKSHPNKMPIKIWAEQIAKRSGRRFGIRTAGSYRAAWAKYQTEDVSVLSFYEKLREFTGNSSEEQLPTLTEDQDKSHLKIVPLQNDDDFEEDPDTENYGKKAVIHAGGQVTTYPAPDEDENSYTVISAKERQEIEQENPELAAILDRDDLSDVHVKIMDFIHRIKDATERGERGWEEIESKGITEANFTGLEQQMMNYALEVFRDCQERQRVLVAKMEQTIGSSQSDANRFMKKVK